MTKVPVWVEQELVVAVHERQLSEHGGPSGTRDESLLESALARPQQLYSYGDPPPDYADLAASLAFGIARNHPFVDGNKRTAAVACELFINLNGLVLAATDEDMLSTFLALAEGSLPEAELAQWIRVHLVGPDGQSIQESAAIYSDA